MSNRTKNKPKQSFPEDVKFIHLRFADSSGNILAGGGTTVAYRKTDAGVEYGISKCHPNDNYVKALGRIKANGRLTSTKFRRVLDRVNEGEFVASLEGMMDGWNQAERFQLQFHGYDPDQAVQMVRKFNGKRRSVVLTEGDALADLNGTPRPDNATVDGLGEVA